MRVVVLLDNGMKPTAFLDRATMVSEMFYDENDVLLACSTYSIEQWDAMQEASREARAELDAAQERESKGRATKVAERRGAQ